jgi:pyruvate dehydrogenase E2 component (dihydrolipoamide acetyltransferase)
MDVTMPQLGETVAEATVTRWLKKVGDVIAIGDALFEVSTDKAEMEIPAITAGTLESVAVQENQTVPVGTVVAIIGDGTTPSAAPATAELSPIVRRLLKENGLAAADVTGTGPHGRITRNDVLALVAGRPTDATPVAPPEVTAPTPQLTPESAPLQESTPAQLRSRETIVPFTLIRRRTAEHMVRSKAVSAHTLMVIEVDFSAVDRVRSALSASWRADEGSSLTYLPFIARAVVDAIAHFPHLNARVGTDQLHVYGNVNLGIAVDLDSDGLVVPVVHDADGKRIRVIAREIAALAIAARNRRTTPDDFAGGTFTITNPGPYGTLITGAVINQPQVAILATDSVRPRPVAVPIGDGEFAVAVRPVGNLALTFDHRAIDGGYAARFLNEVKVALETRDWATEF